MFEQVFSKLDGVLRQEAGCTTELDYTEQTSWLLFLKYLSDIEYEREMEAKLKGEDYSFLLDGAHRWSTWAVPRNDEGAVDHDAQLVGSDLIDFVQGDLFPYLQGFRARASSPDTIEYKIGEIFGEIKNRFNSGYSLRDALELVDQLEFRSQRQKHELSHLYEAKISNMGNAGRNGGEYYTPRPLIRAMVESIDPKVGETIYDPACGSAGFLCEAYEYMTSRESLSTSDVETLQRRTFYGKEKKSLAYIIGVMNMILHGIDAPNIIHTNTLSENLADIQEKDRHDIVLANPPFGGKERREVQHNFPIQTSETAFLFLQHFIKSLRGGGRAAVVIKKTFLSNSDNAAVALRRELLDECNLHSILVCPRGTFVGTGERTVVLFFEKGSPTQKIWYYELDPGRSLGKTNPLSDEDLSEFIELQGTKAISDNSWTVNVTDINIDTYNLSPRNPNKQDDPQLRSPLEVLDEIESLNREAAEVLNSLRGLL